MDNLERALEITSYGIGLVFLSLTLLALVTWGLSGLLKERGPDAPDDGSEPAPVPPTVAPSPGAPVDLGLVAAIAAAVSRTIGATQPAAPSAERAGEQRTASAWRIQGRRTLMESQTAAGRRWRSRG